MAHFIVWLLNTRDTCSATEKNHFCLSLAHTVSCDSGNSHNVAWYTQSMAVLICENVWMGKSFPPSFSAIRSERKTPYKEGGKFFIFFSFVGIFLLCSALERSAWFVVQRMHRGKVLKWKRKFEEGKFSRYWIAFRWFLPTCHESLQRSRFSLPLPPCVCALDTAHFVCWYMQRVVY